MAQNDPREFSHSQSTLHERVLRVLVQLGLAVILVGSNIAQRITFKSIGYSLGPYPFFVLLSLAATFPIIFGVVCIGIVAVSGGFLRETRTWRNWSVFCVMGTCNALQGMGMVFANPHVEGYLQALLQQSMVPFTLVGSVLILRARFSRAQYIGVALIISGVVLQLLPSLSSQHGSSGGGSFIWLLIFVMAQLPVALAAILQEQAFQRVPVNVFLMMFWASTAQFFSLVLLAPLDCIHGVGDASSVSGFLKNFSQAWHLVRNGSAGVGLLGCVAALLSSQFFQMVMVKHSSAAFAVLCMAFVVPGSAVVFTLPLIMGPHAEQLTGTAPIAVALVFFGIVGFKLGERKRVTADHVTLADEPSVPPICTAGTGIVQSEYSNAKKRDISLFAELTLSDVEAAEELSTSRSEPPSVETSLQPSARNDLTAKLSQAEIS